MAGLVSIVTAWLGLGALDRTFPPREPRRAPISVIYVYRESLAGGWRGWFMVGVLQNQAVFSSVMTSISGWIFRQIGSLLVRG